MKRPLFIFLIASIGLLGSGNALRAQTVVHIIVDSVQPSNPPEEYYFYDTQSHFISRHVNGKMIPVALNAFAHTCGGLKYISYSMGDNPGLPNRILVGWELSNRISHLANEVVCMDSVLLVMEGTNSYALDARIVPKNPGRTLVQPNSAQIQDLQIQTLRGMKAVCASEWVINEVPPIVDLYRNWGMLGANGEWLIPPIYDGPFTFERGEAQVARYGRVFWINEQGEEIVPKN